MDEPKSRGVQGYVIGFLLLLERRADGPEAEEG